MDYYWLNQKEVDSSNYRDIEGRVYHYRKNVPGSQQLSKGDWFVYYRPGEYVVFGAGQIGEIEKSKNEVEDCPESMVEYQAHIEEYYPFKPEVDVRNIKNEISFLKDYRGLSGVPQHSIYSISEEDFSVIIENADMGNEIHKP